MDDELQHENSKVPKQLQPHAYRKGQSGNPNGRPKGSISLKQYAKTMLENMTPEEREEFLEGLPKQFIWEMAEGKAQSNTDVTSNGQTIQVIVPPTVANRMEDEPTNPTS
jgi:hypothetical protein